MLLLPAVDIMDGQCVRLYKGRFEQKTQYPTSPINMAKFFASEGGDIIHVIDLDGARTGQPQNLKIIKKICEKVNTPVELGGGIRNEEIIKEVLEIGVSRVILGTKAIEDLDWLEKIVKKTGSEKIVVGIDVHGQHVSTHGWTKSAKIPPVDLAHELEKRGIIRIMYTDISRDGTMTSPNFDLGEKLINLTNLKVITAGGVASLKHLEILRDMGVEGAIIGKALYEGMIDLAVAKKSLNRIKSKP